MCDSMESLLLIARLLLHNYNFFFLSGSAVKTIFSKKNSETFLKRIFLYPLSNRIVSCKRAEPLSNHRILNFLNILIGWWAFNFISSINPLVFPRIVAWHHGFYPPAFDSYLDSYPVLWNWGPTILSFCTTHLLGTELLCHWKLLVFVLYMNRLFMLHCSLWYNFFFFFSIVVNMICWDLFSITFTCMHLRHYFYYTQNDLYYAQNGPVVVKNIVFLDLLLWFLSTWFYKFNVSYNVEYMKLRAWMETFVISFCSCLVFLVSLLARFCLIFYLFLIGW